METTLHPQAEMHGPRPQRLLAGIALSLAAHALLLFAWRNSTLAQRADTPEPPRTIAVWVQPPPPPPSAPAAATGKPSPAARPRAKPRTEVIAVAPKPAPVAQPEPFTIEPTAPKFDPEAAKKIARQVANEPDPAKAGTALERLPQKELQTESKAARAIASAKRRDCKDGIPGGLLAPLVLLMDKKDSGCKW